jgi:general secretion pathway protein G
VQHAIFLYKNNLCGLNIFQDAWKGVITMQNKYIILFIGCILFACLCITCGNPEKEARAMLNQALLLKQDGKFVEAEGVLKKIASQYPKTKAATEALKELEQMKAENTFSNIFSETSSYQAKKVKAQVDIQGFETAVLLYKLDNDMYPTQEQGLKSLVSVPDTGNIPKNWRKSGYIEKGKSFKDPWGNDYVYLNPGIHGKFDITSYGADGKQGGEEENADINSWDEVEANVR